MTDQKVIIERRTSRIGLIISILLSIVLCGFFVCNTKAYAGEKIKLSRTETTLYLGDSETLCLLNTTAAQRKATKWISLDPTVVTVTKKGGQLHAESAGEATVQAKLRGKKYKCVVTVKDPAVIFAEVPEEGNQEYQEDVSPDMTSPSFWYGKVSTAGEELMDRAAINEQNAKNFAASSATNMNDLKNMDISYNSESLKESLVNSLISEVRDGRVNIASRGTIYRNGEALGEEGVNAWFEEMKANIEGAEVKTEDSRKYGICVKRADLWMAPTNALVGWSETDADSELINTSVNVNEPVIMDLTTADGQYTHVKCLNCDGWVETDHFAVCDDKEDWLSQWDFSDGEDMLVVTDSHITLEESNLAPATSKLDLYMGTQLPLVPRDRLTGISERYPWYNYTVYIPVRAEDGKLSREMAMIASHHKVSIGFPEMNVKNILTIAYNCLGDRYGWGGMLGAMDCSLYTRNIYRCFGMEIPRNTNWQAAMPAMKTELTELSEEEKKEVLNGLTPGSLLMFSGHITLYLGEDNGKYYVISDLGSLSESTGEVDVKSIYTVSITSLDVRRRNGNTWLSEMKWAVTPFIPAEDN